MAAEGVRTLSVYKQRGLLATVSSSALELSSSPPDHLVLNFALPASQSYSGTLVRSRMYDCGALVVLLPDLCCRSSPSFSSSTSYINFSLALHSVRGIWCGSKSDCDKWPSCNAPINRSLSYIRVRVLHGAIQAFCFRIGDCFSS